MLLQSTSIFTFATDGMRLFSWDAVRQSAVQDIFERSGETGPYPVACIPYNEERNEDRTTITTTTNNNNLLFRKHYNVVFKHC